VRAPGGFRETAEEGRRLLDAAGKMHEGLGRI